MNFKILIVYFVSFLLISIFMGEHRKVNLQKKSINTISFFFDQKVYIRRNFHSPHMAQLLLSYVTGDTIGLQKKIKETHNQLSVMHLFTPSGIHLSSLYFLFFPLFYFIKKKNKKIYHFLNIISSLPFFLLPGFYSVKRMATLKLVTSSARLFRLNLSTWWAFIIAFSLDVFCGSLIKSPLSFSYSFLFLGAILSISKNSMLQFIFAIAGGQVLICYLNDGSINFLGVILGIFATSVFSLLFPFIFLSYLLCKIIPIWVGETLVTHYYNFIKFLSIICNYGPTQMVSLYLFLIFVAFFAVPHKLLKMAVILLLIFTHYIAG